MNELWDDWQECAMRAAWANARKFAADSSRGYARALAEAGRILQEMRRRDAAKIIDFAEAKRRLRP